VSRRAGFTLVELLIAMAIMATVGCAFVSLMVAGQSIARVQPEAADQQQRARMAIQALAADLARAGTGVERGAQAGSLARFFAPLEPSADAGITVWYVSSRAAQATLAAAFAKDATAVLVDTPSAFTAGSAAMVYDTSGCHDLVRINGVTETSLSAESATRSCAYAEGATIAQAEVRTYRVDSVTRQLLRRDETTGSTLPMLDNISRMQVEFVDGARRVRISLQVSSAVLRRDVPDLIVAFDVVAPNLWLS
jgi:prepilin-type N-terminal cleavage/methylation domain-containing protein